MAISYFTRGYLFSNLEACSCINWSNFVHPILYPYEVPLGNQTIEPFETASVPNTIPSRFTWNSTSAFPSASCGIAEY